MGRHLQNKKQKFSIAFIFMFTSQINTGYIVIANCFACGWSRIKRRWNVLDRLPPPSSPRSKRLTFPFRLSASDIRTHFTSFALLTYFYLLRSICLLDLSRFNEVFSFHVCFTTCWIIFLLFLTFNQLNNGERDLFFE